MSPRRAAKATVILAVAGAIACRSGQQAAAPQGMPPTPVALVTAHNTPIEESTEYVATVKSLRSTAIQPQTDGQITQIHVKSGDRVAAGAPLMQIYLP